MAKTARDDADYLLGTLLPFAEQMLETHGEFFPFGCAMLPDGTITQVAAAEGERPDNGALVELLERGLRAGASVGRYKATAIACDVRCVPPGTTEPSDAISIRIDHEEDYSIEVMVPYRLGPDRRLVHGEIFAQARKASIFPAR